MDKKVQTVITNLDLLRYFPDLDKNLVLLAFMTRNTKYRDRLIESQLLNHYPSFGDINYDMLEFYGDTVLYQLLIEYMSEMNGVRDNLSLLHDTKIKFSNNEFLRQLSHNHNICNTIYNVKPTTKMSKHNVCSDSFEALIGALYVQYGLAGLPKIKEWFSNTFNEIKTEIHQSLHKYTLFPVMDGDQLIERFIKLNPKRNIVQDESGEYTLLFDGNVMSTGHYLDNIIPILRAGKLLSAWRGIVNPDVHEQNYLCNRGSFKHICDNTMTRKLKYNNEFNMCKTQTIKVPAEPCNLVTDEVSVETLDETCDLPPYVYKCAQGVRVAKRGKPKSCKFSPIDRSDPDTCNFKEDHVEDGLTETEYNSARYACSNVDGKMIRTSKITKTGKKLKLTRADKKDCDILNDVLPIDY